MIASAGPGAGQGAADQLGQVVEVLGVVDVEVEDPPARACRASTAVKYDTAIWCHCGGRLRPCA